MEFDFIKHLGVNPNLFDIDKCYEIYDQGIFNHIIILYSKKEISSFKLERDVNDQ